MSAPSAMHAEMQAHARMSALINRRTAFIRLNWNFHFQLSTVAPTRGGLSRGKFESDYEVPCHPTLAEYLDAWLAAAVIGRDKKGPLFRSIGKGDRLSEKAMSRFDVLHMIKRRANAAALPYSTCCHTFRATGITTYLQNGGMLEHAQTLANHESPRTTKLYDRTREELSFDEVERIKI